MVRSYLISIMVVTLLGGCAASVREAAIRPHITLEGHLFEFGALPTIAEGMSFANVRDALGEPLEISEVGDSVTWRYFERANPRWCDGGSSTEAPEYRIQALLVFTNGTLVSKTVEQVGTPVFP